MIENHFNKLSSKKVTNLPWFQYGFAGRTERSSGMFDDAFLQKAINEKKTLRTFMVSTTLSHTEIQAALSEYKFNMVELYSSEEQDLASEYDEVVDLEEDAIECAIFMNEDGDTNIVYQKGSSYNGKYQYISLRTTSKEMFDSLKKVFLPFKKPPAEDKNKSSVGMMLSSVEGISIQKTGKVGCAFTPEYYSAELQKQKIFLSDELKKEFPTGKISILSGPPGTGKTYLIRSIIAELGKHCSFVIVPPSLVAKLGEPDMLPALLSHKKESRPMVLILEDADILVKERMKDSIDAISAALNMGDGILGDVCNIRLLITTNQPIVQIDDAMKRPGRLSSICHVGSLNREEIRLAWNHLSGGKELPKELAERESATIAEIFAHNSETRGTINE